MDSYFETPNDRVCTDEHVPCKASMRMPEGERETMSLMVQLSPSDSSCSVVHRL